MDIWPTWSGVDEYRRQLEAEYEDHDESPQTPKRKEAAVEINPAVVDGVGPEDTLLDVAVENDVFAMVAQRDDGWCLVVSDGAAGVTKDFPQNPRDDFHSLHLDPQGHHILLSCASGENKYYNTREGEAMRPRPLEKLNNRITAVAWDRTNKRNTSSGSILVGDSRGTVYLARLEKGMGFTVLQVVFDVSSRLDCPTVTGIAIERFSDRKDRLLVLIATLSRLYEFHGGPTLEDVFQKQVNINTHKQFVKLHSSGPLESRAGLRTLNKGDGGSLGWCSSAGLYHATLRWPGEGGAAAKDVATAGPAQFHDADGSYNLNSEFNAPASCINGGSYFSILREAAVPNMSSTNLSFLTPTPPADAAPPGGPTSARAPGQSRLSYHAQHQKEDVEKVLGLLLGETTMIMLFQESLQIVAQPAGLRWRALSEPFDRIKPEELKDRRLYHLPLKRPVNLYTDSATSIVYLTTARAVYELTIPDVQASQAWKSFLIRAMKQDEPDRAQYFVAASRLVKDDKLNEQIKIKAADFFFEEGSYVHAAEIYAETYASFEDISMKLVHCGNIEALLMYLTKRIEFMKNRSMYWGQERSQLACLTTWTCKVYLDLIMSLDKTREDPTKMDEIKQNFHTFVQGNMQHIQAEIVHEIVYSYRLNDELLFFASITKDYRAVVSYYMEDGNFNGVLNCLKKHCLTKKSMVNLWYQCSSRLIQHVPVDLVSAWMEEEPDDQKGGGAAGVLVPSKLIPAVLQYNVKHNPPGVRENQAVRYLHWVVNDGQSTDPAIHNLVIFLSASDSTKPEAELVKFLVDNQDDYYFDEKYALRICLQNNRFRAAAHIYALMGMHGDAVELCLQRDHIQLAKELASQQPDEAVKKQLWVSIARHVLQRDSDNAQEGGGVQASLAMLRECTLLRLDDILPLFGDDVLIADFKEEVWEGLSEYNYEIEDLKRRRHELTHDASSINTEIDLLRQRPLFMQNDSRCKLCHKPLFGSGNFYAFPLCKEEFHQDCLRHHVTASDAVTEEQRMRILELHEKVQSVTRQVAEGKEDPVKVAEAREAKRALDLLVADQCPCCGDLKIQEATQPFSNLDAAEAQSWDI